ncbi:hypothetical protein LSH36_164g09003 [Paralvinella palmiformis]|uniref:Uncharacterized protein n=1 Tax=Paralvinella palmiformis TaxID=53620 RepID=A0AAD9JTD0_9ANNE|nr:hypothetical protein LSH36_164g09003 [Paralvinella palmiformis]
MRNVRVFRLLTFCVFIVSVGLHVTAFSSSFWFKRRDIYGWLVHHGLWTFCDYYRSGGIDNKCLKLVNRYDDFENGKLSSVQALMCIALVCHIITTLIFTIWLTCPERRMDPKHSLRIGIAGFVMCIFSGLLTLTSVTIFGVYYAKFKHVLNWSYILATISGGILFIGGIVGLILLVRAPFSKFEELPEPANQCRLPPLPVVTSHDLAKPVASTADDVGGVYPMAEYDSDKDKMYFHRFQSPSDPISYTNSII